MLSIKNQGLEKNCWEINYSAVKCNENNWHLQHNVFNLKVDEKAHYYITFKTTQEYSLSGFLHRQWPNKDVKHRIMEA